MRFTSPLLSGEMIVITTCGISRLGERLTGEQFMNETQHTFPLPESAVKNLAEVEGQIQRQPFRLKVKDSVRANRWRAVAIVTVMGLLLGLCLGRKAGHCQAG